MEAVVASYFPVLVFLVIACGLSLILIGAPFLLAKLKPDAEKLSPYECGFEPFDDARFVEAWHRVVERRALRTIRDESQRLALMLALLDRAGAPAGYTAQSPSPARWVNRLVITKDQRTYMLPLTTVA